MTAVAAGMTAAVAGMAAAGAGMAAVVARMVAAVAGTATVAGGITAGGRGFPGKRIEVTVDEGESSRGARTETAARPVDGAPAPPRPVIRRGWRYTDLQFEGGVSQSRMRTFRPGQLAVDYTRTMMASLLWQPRPALVGMVGLGGGSQVKFCHRHLPHTRMEVAEINPQVIALRRTFRVPDDDARLRVHLADGAR